MTNKANINPAVCLYRGKVTHARLKPFAHRFAYRVFSILIDLDGLEEADQSSALFSVGRRNILSFYEADHGSANNIQRPKHESLRQYVNGLLAGAGLDAHELKVELLCYPRIFGYVFNPISVYFVSAANGDVVALIYEVRNTFGEMHTYVQPVLEGQMSSAGIRQEQSKNFYVSPFMPMNLHYRFRIGPPAQDVKLRILEFDDDGPVLSASFFGARFHATNGQIFNSLLSMGFFSFKIMFGIHWEAAKLWIKGAKFHSRPKPPKGVSIKNGATK